MISPAALREIQQLQNEASGLINRRSVSRADGKRADPLLAKIANIRSTGLSTDESLRHVANELGREIGAPIIEFDESSPEERSHQKLFRGFLSGTADVALEQETRATTFLAGTQTPIFTSGASGGFLVPIKFSEKVAEGRALVDRLFYENVVT